jgi:RND family efflux transporter MFP subunit
MKNNNKWWALVLLAGLLQPVLAAEAVSVRVVTPQRGDVLRYVALPGTLVAEQEATIYAKVPGYLRSLTVDVGDRVIAGQSLGELEMPELEADAARFAAHVRVAESEYERLLAAREQAPDLVVPQTVDEALGRLEIARADRDRTERLLAYARLTAPFEGLVTRRHVDPGAYVPAATSGASANTAAIVTLMDVSKLRIQVPVPEREAALVRQGQPLRVSVDGIDGRRTATVSRLSFALDPDSRTMLVEADIDNTDETLRPGMYAHAEIGLERHEGVLTVPAAAVRTERAGSAVFVVTDNVARRVPVTVGFNDGEVAEIAQGLQGNEAIAVPPAGVVLVDGQPLNRSTTP